MNPDLRASTLDLYRRVWGTLPDAIELASRWGADWFAASTPHLHLENGRVVAHVGLTWCRLVVHGTHCRIPALHAVCVDADYRGRGLGRRCIESALAEIEATASGAPVILWSESCALYAKFGFFPRRESIFVAPLPAAAPVPSRRLDLDRSEALDQLRRGLPRRTPVSSRLAAGDRGSHFLIDLAIRHRETDGKGDRLAAVDDAIVVYGIEGDRLKIYDVIATRHQPVAHLVGGIRHVEGGRLDPVTRVHLYIEPGLVEGDFRPEAHPDVDVLLVRGRWPVVEGAHPFALSVLSRT